MDANRKLAIRECAEQLLVKSLAASRGPQEFGPIQLRTVERCAADHLSLQIIEVRGSSIGWAPNSNIVGELDRENQAILIARDYPREQRRFTTAHEIGHYCLHKELIQHRDRPSNLGSLTPRNSKEKEADFFAGHLLAPQAALRPLFLRMFGREMFSTGEEEITLRLLRGGVNDLRVNPLFFSQMSPVARAEVFARWSVYPHAPLTEQFCLTSWAIAIQLVELGLVH